MASSFDLPPELWRIVLDHLSHGSNWGDLDWFKLDMRHHREFSLVSRQFRELGKPYIFRSICIASGNPLINGDFNNLLLFLKLSPDIAKHVWGLSLLGHSDEIFEMFISTGWLTLDILAEIIRALSGLQKLHLYELALVSTSTAPFPAPIARLAELTLNLDIDHNARSFDSDAICFPGALLRLLSLFSEIGNLTVSSLKEEPCKCADTGGENTEGNVATVLQLHCPQPLSLKSVRIERIDPFPVSQVWFSKILAASSALLHSLSSVAIKFEDTAELIEYDDFFRCCAPYIEHFGLSFNVGHIQDKVVAG